MRVAYAFVALLGLVVAHHGGPHGIPDLFEGHKEYVYKYRSLVATGVPRQSTRYSGLEKLGELTVQVYEQQGNSKIVGFRLGQVKSGSFDQEVDDIENRRVDSVQHAVEDTVEKYGPVFVRYQDNAVQKLRVPQGMPEEITNIYRGIAAVFTVGKPEGENAGKGGRGAGHGVEPIVYTRQEHGITGNFETIYEVVSGYGQTDRMNVTKTMNYYRSIGRDGRFFQNGHDERGCQTACQSHKPEQIDGNMQPDTSVWEKPVTEGCPVGFHPKKELVEAYTSYGYNMSVVQGGKYAVIEEAHALDKRILPLRLQQISTVNVVKVVLVKQGPISQPWQQQAATKQYDDITYRFPEGHKFDLEYLALYNKANDGELLKGQIVPMVKALAEVIVSDNIELRGQTGNKIVQLTMALGNLDKQGLQALWAAIGEHASGNGATELDTVQRKVLIDVVGLSGSNAAAEFLVELIRQQKFTTLEAVHTFETLQKSMVRPTIRIMKLLLGVCTDPKFHDERTVFSTACIAFGEIARGNCANHQTRQWQLEQQTERKGHTGTGYEQIQYCGEQELQQFVHELRGKLQSAQGYAEQVVYIQTLGRLAHPEALKALVPYVYGEKAIQGQLEQVVKADQHEDSSEYTQFVRQVAIYSLHPAAKQHPASVQPIVQGIYFDQDEDYEIRIAALSVLLASQPSEATFGRIVIELGREHDEEVASYAYSALHSIANATTPCMSMSARRVQNVLGSLSSQTFGGHRSMWGMHSQYKPSTQSGLEAHWELTQSNVSAVPRFLYGSVTGNKGPFVSTIVDVGMISKGFENLDQLVKQFGGIDKIIDNIKMRLQRQARSLSASGSVQQMLGEIEHAMQFNTDEQNEQFRAVAFGNMLGNEVYVPIDKEYVGKLAKTAGAYMVKMLSEEGEAQKTFRYVRVLMPRTYVHVSPGVTGLPILISNRHPIVVSVAVKDFQTRFGAEKGAMKMFPMVAAVGGLVQPTVYHTSIHSALTINPTQQIRQAYGVRAVEQTYMSLPIDFAVQYTQQTGTVGVTIRPRLERVFFHKARAMTFKTEALLIRAVERPLLEQYATIKTQQKPFVYERVWGENLGMPLRVQGMSMNEEYAVEYLRSVVAGSGENNVVSALMKDFANDWFVPRTWAVRVDQSNDDSVHEIKMFFRLGNLLWNRAQGKKAGGQNSQQQQQQQQRLSQQQMTNEKAYPEQMRMIAFDQEYETITGRKPATEPFNESVQRIAKKTEKYWSQVDRDLQQKMNEDNTEVYSLEYVVAANGQKKQIGAVSGHIIGGSTLSRQATLGEIKMNVEQRPMSFECQLVSAFTKTPQPFETEIGEQEPRAIVGFLAELDTEMTGKQQYSGRIAMSKSEEQKRLMRMPVDSKPWFYRQCAEDKRDNEAEMSTACELTRYHKSALNQIRLEIELPQKVHERLANLSHQAREALKVHLYRNLEATYSPEMTNTKADALQAVLTYYDRIPEVRMANLTIRTPDHEELRFERIDLPKALRPNTMWSLKEQILAFFKNDRPEPVCIYNGQNLRTFDNVTLSLETMKTGEKYVIARDNDEDSKFTIVGEKQQGGQATEIEVLLRGATVLTLTPPNQQGEYKVRVNGSELSVSPKQGLVRQYAGSAGQLITLNVDEHKEGRNTLVVMVRDQGMQVVYDGRNFKVEIANCMQKGQLTGLCGDMNNKRINELTGPRGCSFEREEDFVRAFGLNMKQGKGLMGDWSCPEGVSPRGASQAEISKKAEQKKMMQQHDLVMSQQRQGLRKQHNLIMKATKMVPMNGKLCFSVEPVNVCKLGSQQMQSEKQSIEFACLQANSQRAMQLQKEVQTQKIAHSMSTIVSRLGRDEMMQHEIDVATRCSQ